MAKKPHAKRDSLHAAFGLVLAAWGEIGARAFPPKTIPAGAPLQFVRVVSRQVVADNEDVVALELVSASGRPLLAWRPGAHVDVHLPTGYKRQYSLCGDPGDATRYRIAVRRIPAEVGGRGGSLEMHELAVGDTFEISHPRNAFPLALPGFGSTAQRLHFVAGGIGITPILSMVGVAEEFGVDWTLTYAGRTAASIPFLAELARYGDRVTVLTDDVSGIPTGDALLGDIAAGTAVYCCGPESMLATIQDHLDGRWDVELHFERFGAPPIRDGVAFTVELANTGEIFNVAADRSVLDYLIDAHPRIAYSCHQGFCGSCVLEVLDGNPEHRDTYLDDDERAEGQFMPCVSRSRGGRLVLRSRTLSDLKQEGAA